MSLDEGDARDLSRFADGRFALVFFSFNGIDGLAHEDRAVVLREVREVLEPNGLFVYSTHNLDHTGGGGFLGRGVRQAVRRPRRALRYLRALPSAASSYRRLRRHVERGDGWAVGPDAAYGFSVVWHSVTLAEAVAELTARGVRGCRGVGERRPAPPARSVRRDDAVVPPARAGAAAACGLNVPQSARAALRLARTVIRVARRSALSATLRCLWARCAGAVRRLSRLAAAGVRAVLLALRCAHRVAGRALPRMRRPAS